MKDEKLLRHTTQSNHLAPPARYFTRGISYTPSKPLIRSHYVGTADRTTRLTTSSNGYKK